MRRAFVVGWVLAVLAGLTGCVSVPTSGPIEPGGLSTGTQAPRVEIQAAPPAKGAPPGLIVEGFLHAMSSAQGNYDIARQYLLEPARAGWHPEQAVLVYDDSYPMSITDDKVVLNAPLEGVLHDDGSYTHTDEPYRIDFGLTKDASGEWRIANPPQGALVSQYLFDQFYRRVNLYFFDPAFQTLVPDPIFIPRSSQSATTVLQALLRGPTRWLAPGVATAVPAGTESSLSAPVGDGVVEVQLSAAISGLDEVQRSRMAAQMSWTLAQIEGVRGIRLTVDGKRYSVREQDTDGVIPVTAFGTVDPIPGGGEQALLGGKDGVSRLAENDGRVTREPIEGQCGHLGRPVSALTSSPAVTGGRTAVVTGGRLLLCGAGPNGGAVEARGLRGAQGRPQITRFGELWQSVTRGGSTELWRVGDDGAEKIASPGLGRVRAFRVSPDGTRLAMVRQVAGEWQLGISLINRTGGLRIEGWQAIGLTKNDGQGPANPLDVDWASDSTLMILGAESATARAKPYVVGQDGTNLRQIGPGNWSPKSLATRPKHGDPEALVVGADGSAWRYQDDYRWPFLIDQVTAAAYSIG